MGARRDPPPGNPDRDGEPRSSAGPRGGRGRRPAGLPRSRQRRPASASPVPKPLRGRRSARGARAESPLRRVSRLAPLRRERRRERESAPAPCQGRTPRGQGARRELPVAQADSSYHPSYSCASYLLRESAGRADTTSSRCLRWTTTITRRQPASGTSRRAGCCAREPDRARGAQGATRAKAGSFRSMDRNNLVARQSN